MLLAKMWSTIFFFAGHVLPALTVSASPLPPNSQQQQPLAELVVDDSVAHSNHLQAVEYTKGDVICYTAALSDGEPPTLQLQTTHSTLTVHRLTTTTLTRTKTMLPPTTTEFIYVTTTREVGAWWWDRTSTVTVTLPSTVHVSIGDPLTAPVLETRHEPVGRTVEETRTIHIAAPSDFCDVSHRLEAVNLFPLRTSGGFQRQSERSVSIIKNEVELLKIRAAVQARQHGPALSIQNRGKANVTCYRHITKVQTSTSWVASLVTVSPHTMTRTSTITVTHTSNRHATATTTLIVGTKASGSSAGGQTSTDVKSTTTPSSTTRVIYDMCQHESTSANHSGAGVHDASMKSPIHAMHRWLLVSRPQSKAPQAVRILTAEAASAYECCVAAWRHPEARKSHGKAVWDFSAELSDIRFDAIRNSSHIHSMLSDQPGLCEIALWSN